MGEGNGPGDPDCPDEGGNDPDDNPMAEITKEPAPREQSHNDVQCASLPNRNDDAAQGDRKDDQNSEDGEGTGKEHIEKGATKEEDSTPQKYGAKQDTGAGGDVLSDTKESLGGNKQQKVSMNAPNPFRDPRLVEKFWHKKFNMVKYADEEQVVDTEDEQKEGDKPLNGEEETTSDLHEFTNTNQDSTTQVLEKEAEEDAAKLDLDDDEKEFDPATYRGNGDPAKTENQSVQKESKKQKLSAEPTPQKEKHLDSEQNAEDTDQDVNMYSQSSFEPEDPSEEEETEPNKFAKMNLLQLQDQEGEEPSLPTDKIIEDLFAN